MYHRASFVTAFLLLTLAAPLAHAQVPSFQEVVGHEFGDRITQNYQSVQYLEAVADASDRVVLEELGESWQGRRMVMAILTSPENHARLDEIQQNAQRLGDPRDLSEADAEAIIVGQPAILYFGGSIHGFELSGAEGALKLLERLVTRDDAETRRYLENTVVLIDPIINPDGRDAFAYLNHDNLGREANPDNNDWSNDVTSWQGLKFRTGHYYFDTNRDWFAHTQRETQARVPMLQAWRPQAGVDAHEMGADVEFYIDPPTDPVGPFFPDYASTWLERFGEAYARAFDETGVDYMTRERFNYFYPAYTTSYLSYQGAVGMLYEQGSSRGLALTRPDETVRTLADGAEQQYTLAVAAVELMTTEREAMLRDYVAAHREAIADGEQGTRRYLLTADGDPHLVAEVADLLRRNGVEVHRLSEEATLSGVSDRTGSSAGNHTFEAGTYVVEAAQPRNRLVRVLLEPHVPIPEDFLEEARARVDRGENPRFYDITAWSLPLLFNIGGYSSTDGQSLSTEPMEEPITVAHDRPNRNARYAYLIDGEQAAGLPALIHLKKKGHRVAMLSKPTRLDGQNYASGTGIVYVGQNSNDVHGDVREVADRYALDVHGVDSGLAEVTYPSLGSGDVIYLREPSVALLAEDPIHAYSFGWAWYMLDRQYELPVSVLRTQSLGSAPLSDYTTIVLPEVINLDALERIAGEDALERLAQWVREGGTLVTIGSGTEVAREKLELISLRSWYDEEENEDAQRVTTPGAFLGTELDREEWLTAGVPNSFPALVNSNRIYLAPEGPPSPGQRTPVRYAEGDDFHIAGHTWEESDERLPGAVVAYEERVGNGRVIAFAEDPNFRAYWRGADRLFLNAVLAGPSAP